MNKTENYIAVDFSSKKKNEISKKGLKELFYNIETQLLEMADTSLKLKKPILGKVTIEYGTEEEWKTKQKCI